jgi:hypothetical protein
LAGATITARCANGSGQALSNAVGAFELRIAGASLPCVLRADGADGSRFHAALPAGSGAGPFRVNLTPLTEWQLASASTQSPVALFESFAVASVPTAAQMDLGLQRVRAALRPTVDLTGLEPTTAVLVAATASTPGDRHDQLIDTAMAAVSAARIEVPAVASALAANPTVPDPVQSLMRPAASTCAWLRSGAYQVVSWTDTASLRLRRLTIDAPAAQVNMAGLATSWVGSSCGYYLDSGVSNDTVLATPGGVLVGTGRLQGTAGGSISWLAWPEQNLPLSEWGGAWNAINWELLGSVVAPVAAGSHSEMAIDLGGRVTSAAYCFGLASCTTIPAAALPSVTVNPAGGFNLVRSGVAIGRAFLYRHASGERLGVLVSSGGDVTWLTPRTATGAATVGALTKLRQVNVLGDRSISFADFDSRITTFDATTRDLARQRSVDGWIERLRNDAPRAGLLGRGSGTCSGAAFVPCDEMVEMPLRAMGLTLGVSSRSAASASHALSIAVVRP